MRWWTGGGRRTHRPHRDDGRVDAPDLTWRPLTRDDVPALTELRNLAEDADGTHQPMDAEQVAEELDRPRFDPATDTLSAWDGDVLVAAGSASVRSEPVDGRALVGVDGVVHPAHRGRGTGVRVLRELEGLGLAAARRRLPGEPVRLRGSGGLEGSGAQRLLEQEGYQPDNRFVTMQVDLADWDDPGHPSSAVTPDHETLPATREAHNDAFRDHRNHSDIPADAWQHWTGSSASRPPRAPSWSTTGACCRTPWRASSSRASCTSRSWAPAERRADAGWVTRCCCATCARRGRPATRCPSSRSTTTA